MIMIIIIIMIMIIIIIIIVHSLCNRHRSRVSLYLFKPLSAALATGAGLVSVYTCLSPTLQPSLQAQDWHHFILV